MQHFCEALKPGPHRAIYREMVAKYPEINPLGRFRRLKMPGTGSN
jgi:hypothetical protein